MACTVMAHVLGAYVVTGRQTPTSPNRTQLWTACLCKIQLWHVQLWQADAELAESITGVRPSVAVSSASGQLFVEFTSDGSVGAAGFAATFVSSSSAASSAPVQDPTNML